MSRAPSLQLSPLRIAAVMAAVVAAMIWVAGCPSRAEGRTPASAMIVVDAASGDVLAAQNADAPRWPASLVKMMTVYLAFEAMAAGAIDAETRVRVGPNAASQPPMRLGLRAGEIARFGDLVAAAAVASANDAATAVAETLSGSETRFVDQMNAAARRLGMRGTRYANAAGLPQPGQQTTARDMAILARALLTKHPERSKVFALRSGRLNGRSFRTTNRLLAGYPGALGLKTGFTCRAGYHLAAAARRDGRTMVAIALGAANGDARAAAARAALDLGFAAGDAGRSVGRLAVAPAAIAVAAPPSAAVCAPSETDGRRGLWGWGVFVGAHSTRDDAQAALDQAAALAKTRGAQYVSQRARDGLWAAALSGYRRSEAIRTCAALRRADRHCLTLSPDVLADPAAAWR